MSDQEKHGTGRPAFGEPQAWEILARIAADNAPGLVRTFYDTLLQDPEAARFLNHSMVETGCRRLCRSGYATFSANLRQTIPMLSPTSR